MHKVTYYTTILYKSLKAPDGQGLMSQQLNMQTESEKMVREQPSQYSISV